MRVLDVKILVLSSRSNELVGEFKSEILNGFGHRDCFGFSSAMEAMSGVGDPSILGDR